MKKFGLFILLIFGGFLGLQLGNVYKKETKSAVKKEKKITPTKKISVKSEISSRSLFVPYWSLTEEENNFNDYDTLIYFGITPDYQGINKREEGYKGLSSFTKVSFDFVQDESSGKQKLLTVRMINDEVNNFVLENKKVQEKIISETLEIVEQNSFAGIVLDLEISGLASAELTGKINDLVQIFYSSSKENYRKFYLAIYGDNFYRKRPFDLEFLGKNSDGVMIMAYDFHKSRGEPGPNFPFDSGRQYAYSFKTMISDFLKYIPKEKITVIFGMFGYDWLVDEKKRPIRQAEALSLNEIRQKFLEKCEFKNCVTRKDPVAKESEVNYIISSNVPDDQNIYRIDYHIVWFEDEESVKEKTEYLKELGIDKVSYWANGYF